MPRKRTESGKPQEEAQKFRVISDKAVQIAEWVSMVLVAAERSGIKNKPLPHFWLAPAQREVLLKVPDLSIMVRSKLANEKSSFTVAEIAGMTMAVAEDLPAGDAQRQVPLLLVVSHLVDRLREGVVAPAKMKDKKVQEPKTKADTKTLYQLKITLVGSKPPIWRRIQVKDCTLSKLHEHIQTAMGWTNSHLHQFEINGRRCGDRKLLDDSKCIDSTRTKISQIVPEDAKRFKFLYEYDFGDGWMHEILFEGCPLPEKGKKYPVCLEGERACPPEDVGGIGGFEEYLEALADPKHERHEELLEWAGPFDPEKFDAVEATNEMREGLPEWGE